MPYEFVVWHGSPPLSDAHAASEHKRHRADAAASVAEPTDSIRELISRLTAIHPDRVVTDTSWGSGGADSPWIDSPLMKQARGPVAVIRVDESRADDVRPLLIDVTTGRGLVVYDPQRRTMVPSASATRRSVRFQLPQPAQLDVHLNALLSEQIGAPAPVVGVLEHLGSGYYLQWLAEPDSVTVEAQGDEVVTPELRLSDLGRDRMSALGFEAGSPNWVRRCGADDAGIADAARVICSVLFEVRGVTPGDGVSIQTFPVHA